MLNKKFETGKQIYQKYAKNGTERVKIYHLAKNGIWKNWNIPLQIDGIGIIKIYWHNKLVLKQLKYIWTMGGVLT